jgi:hypothetical protein
LSGTAQEIFISKVPSNGTLTSTFDFQKEIFEDALPFRVFHLDTGVVVSSPLSEIDKSVLITGDKREDLSCSGKILEEKLRKRHE